MSSKILFINNHYTVKPTPSTHPWEIKGNSTGVCIYRGAFYYESLGIKSDAQVCLTSYAEVLLNKGSSLHSGFTVLFYRK